MTLKNTTPQTVNTLPGLGDDKPKDFDIVTAKAKHQKVRAISFKTAIIALTIFVIAFILFLIGYIIYSSVPMYHYISFWKFIFTADWRPAENKFGIGLIIAMTLMLLSLTMLFAVPLTIFTTLFISEYLSPKTQKVVITLIQLLAGVPSVVFGLFAREYIGALFRLMGAHSNDNMMVGVLTMTFMAIPTMISLSYNAVKSVPEGYRYGSLALGISREKTAFSIVLKSATPKIITAIILGMSRVIGETMALMMIVGNASGDFDTSSFAHFLFSSIRTLATTIGLEISETASSQHKAALFAIATFLLILVFIINLTVLVISNWSRNKNQRANRLRQKQQAKIHKEKFIKHEAIRDGDKGKEKTAHQPIHRQQMQLKIAKLRMNNRFNKHQMTTKTTNYYTNAELTEMVNLKTKNKFWKKFYSGSMLTLMILATTIVLCFIAWLLGTVIVRGLMSLKEPQAFITINGQDGIFAALFTTILLILATLLFAIPLALVVAVYINEYANQNSWSTKSLRFLISMLSSTPSIIFGIFGLQIFIVALGLPFSIFASSLTMTIVILPALITNFEDALSSVPFGYREAGAGLGMTNLQQLFRIVIPYASEGLMTGVILAMARIIGESAPVYLTLGTAIRMPAEGFLSQGATLTTAIYMLAAEAQPDQQGSIYLIALITVALVFALNLGSQKISTVFTTRAKENVNRITRLKNKTHEIKHGFLTFSYERWQIKRRISWRSKQKIVQDRWRLVKMKINWQAIKSYNQKTTKWFKDNWTAKGIRNRYHAWLERRRRYKALLKREEN